MPTLFWILIGVVGAFGLSVGATASTRLFARRIWRDRRLVWDWEYVGSSLDRTWAWRRSKLYDDSSYAHRDSPHTGDYWHAFGLTLAFFVSYPIMWGSKIATRRRKRQLAEWEIARNVRQTERDRKAEDEKLKQAIVDELAKGGNE